MTQNVNIQEVITLLLADGKDPSEVPSHPSLLPDPHLCLTLQVAHLGDPESDQMLIDTGVKLDRAHRILLRAGE